MLKVRLATVMCFAAGIISAVEVVTPERELPLPAAVDSRRELAVFPVESQEFYTVELTTAASPEAGYVLQVDFFDSDGRNIAVLEKTLSIRESNIRAEGRAGQQQDRAARARVPAGNRVHRVSGGPGALKNERSLPPKTHAQ